MATFTVLTLYVAQVLGLYLILVGISGLATPQRWTVMMDEIAGSPALQMAMGVLVFAIGATLVHVHCIFTDPLAVVVTLIGWIALVEGALLIAVPGPLMRIGRASLKFTRIWAIVSLVLGILIGLAGLTGTADATHYVSQKGLSSHG